MNADVIDRLYGEVADKLEGLPRCRSTAAPADRTRRGIYRREDATRSGRGQEFPTFARPNCSPA